jgi:hypothetical protein
MTVVLKGYEPCKLCKGRGRDKYGERPCPFCNGTTWAMGRVPSAVTAGHVLGVSILSGLVATGAWFFLAWGLEMASPWWRGLIVAVVTLTFGRRAWAGRFQS